MQSILDLGIDVDSRFIVVACAAGSFRPQRIANERKAILAWLRTLPRGSRLGMEATGGYHELLAELACKAGLQVFVINPRDLRRYAEGVGRRGKTDRMDAEVIAPLRRPRTQRSARLPAAHQGAAQTYTADGSTRQTYSNQGQHRPKPAQPSRSAL
jgi:transposase